MSLCLSVFWQISSLIISYNDQTVGIVCDNRNYLVIVFEQGNGAERTAMSYRFNVKVNGCAERNSLPTNKRPIHKHIQIKMNQLRLLHFFLFREIKLKTY